MELINIKKYHKNFNIVIPFDSNEYIRTNQDFFPYVSEYISRYTERYNKDKFFIYDLCNSNDFFTIFMSKVIGFKNVIKIISHIKFLKRIQQTIALNTISNIEVYNSKNYNSLMRDRDIAFAIMNSFEDLKFIKLVMKSERLHNIIILNPHSLSLSMKKDLNSYGYNLYEIADRGIKDIEDYEEILNPVLVRHKASLTDEKIIVRFD